MILYQVSKGVITAMSVVRETNCGWREHNGGFINRSILSEKYPRLSGYYYTTDIAEAKKWSGILIGVMSDTLQAAKASLDDIIAWDNNGADESNLPKPRQ